MRSKCLAACFGAPRTPLPNGSGIGLVRKKNGDLLKLAEDAFDVLITIDTNLRYQQNLIGRKIAILLLAARSNRLDTLSTYFSACAQVLESIKPGDFVEVGDMT